MKQVFEICCFLSLFYNCIQMHKRKDIIFLAHEKYTIFLFLFIQHKSYKFNGKEKQNLCKYRSLSSHSIAYHLREYNNLKCNTK